MSAAMCQCRACDAPAAWSVTQEAWRSRPAGPRLMCDAHKQSYFDATPIKGIDRPYYASDEWRPSIVEMISHAAMEIRRQELAGEMPIPATVPLLKRQLNFTPAQRMQLAFLHRALSQQNQTGGK